MHFISGTPDNLTVTSAPGLIKSIAEDIVKLSILKDELTAYSKASGVIAEAAEAKAAADAYVAQTKIEIDALKASVSEKLAKAKKREAESETVAVSVQADRDSIQAEKDAAEKDIAVMWDTLKVDIVKLNNDQSDMIAKQSKYDQDRADLDARIAKFQATVALLSQ